ncbi:MAG: flagellar protein FlaG [Deltaproteobacteria bacterium]|nr:flagellar protein FlaG [Deltaproteobacteria bacterium]
MDASMNTEVKGYGAPVIPAIIRDDQVKPQIAPVQKGGEATAGALDDRALHGQNDAGQQPTAPKLSEEELARAVEGAQKRLDAIGSNLRLGIYETPKHGNIVVQIRDKKDNKLIRQIPSEAALKLRSKLDELAGLLLNTKA